MEPKSKEQRIRERLDIFEEDLQFIQIFRDGLSSVVDIYDVYELINNIRDILAS